MPRPLMTAASKSALIEQLKARHSSQQQKLQELAIRVEQTRKDNRRLRNTLLLLARRWRSPSRWRFFATEFFPHPPARHPRCPTMSTTPRAPRRRASGLPVTRRINRRGGNGHCS